MQALFDIVCRGSKKIVNAILPKTKTQWFATAGFLVLIAVLSGSYMLPAYAQEAAKAPDGTFTDMGVGLIRMAAEALLALARICISLTVFALEFFIKLAKYNGFVDAPIVILGWTMVRDIANMFFVVVLLVIAFGTILGLEQYEWKKTMASFIMAAVFINFSKLICGIIIDVAHVFTMTFVNAIAATAGGNLISMFHLDKVLSIVGGDFANKGSEIILEIFGGSVMALVFAVLAMFTMGAYMIILVIRLVVLWALIILSPLAYIMSIIPQTQSYASTWWSEFGKHVAVAPVMVFFLWLGFATLGSGNFAGPDLQMQFDNQAKTSQALGIQVNQTEAKASISEVTTWENMANFILAMAFLWIGIEQVQKMGVRGGKFVQSAIDAAQTAALLASGYAAGRWLVGKGEEGGKGLIGQAAYRVPIVGGRAWEERGFKTAAWWQENVSQARNEKAKKLDEKYRDLQKKRLDVKYKGTDSKYAGKDLSLMGNWEAYVGRFKASLWETQGRKDKIRDDAKETLERRNKVVEELYSTSGLPNGIAKQEVTGQLKFVEKLSSDKGPQKVADIMALILGNEEAYKMYAEPALKAGEKKDLSETREKIAEKKRMSEIRGEAGSDSEKTAKEEAELQLREGVLKGLHDIKLDDAVAKLFEDTRNDALAQIFVEMQQQKDLAAAIRQTSEKEREKEYKGTVPAVARAQDIAEQKATFENLQKTITRATEVQLSVARAAEYNNQGRYLNAQQVVQSTIMRHEDEDSKEIGGLNREQRKAVAESLLNAISTLGENDPKRREAQRDMARLIKVSADKGADDYESVVGHALKKMYSDKGQLGNLEITENNTGKHLLELIGGKLISSNAEFNSAETDFRKTFKEGNAGELERQAVLASMQNAFWNQGESGGANASTAIIGRPQPINIGGVTVVRRNFDVTNPYDNDDKNEAAGTTEALMTKYVRFRDVNTIDGLVNVKPGVEVENARKKKFSQISGLSETQIQNLITTHTTFGDEREVASGFHQGYSASVDPARFTKEAKAGMVKVIQGIHAEFKERGQLNLFKKVVQTQYAGLYRELAGQLKTAMGADFITPEDMFNEKK